eukprot:243207-Hanusia_phi.AAC.1
MPPAQKLVTPVVLMIFDLDRPAAGHPDSAFFVVTTNDGLKPDKRKTKHSIKVFLFFSQALPFAVGRSSIGVNSPLGSLLPTTAPPSFVFFWALLSALISGLRCWLLGV